ncbi:hypothetical protein [Candidatus Albibeggiatoa sp. nov. NOAA]|nr:hypothetical protein [Thiotrichaceae bacterium]
MPPEIGLLQNLTELHLVEHNLLVTPPLEIVEQGIPAIREYFANQ